MKARYLFALLFLINLVGFISAFPGPPHKFYGEVRVNGELADNNLITASVEGETYITISENGYYGLSPNTFYVEDPDGDRAGRTVFFYVGGKAAGNVTFQNGGYTKLDFDLTTTCGDNYCLGDETCGACPTDCGICTTPPVITITSPENNKEYNISEVELKVSADQPILIWLYALNSENFITFNPNITLTLSNGNYTLDVLGINQQFQSGSRDVSFIVNIPYCGDSVCNNAETCSTCSADCGACPSTGSSGSSGGGGGGGGGIISIKTNKTNSTTENIQKTNFVQEENTNTQNPDEEEGSVTQNQENKNPSLITGAFVAIKSTITKSKALAFIGLIAIIAIILMIGLYFKKKKAKNPKNKFDY